MVKIYSYREVVEGKSEFLTWLMKTDGYEFDRCLKGECPSIFEFVARDIFMFGMATGRFVYFKLKKNTHYLIYHLDAGSFSQELMSFFYDFIHTDMREEFFEVYANGKKNRHRILDLMYGIFTQDPRNVVYRYKYYERQKYKGLADTVVQNRIKRKTFKSVINAKEKYRAAPIDFLLAAYTTACIKTVTHRRADGSEKVYSYEDKLELPGFSYGSNGFKRDEGAGHDQEKREKEQLSMEEHRRKLTDAIKVRTPILPY